MPALFDENIVPHWHRSKPKFMAMLRAYLEPLEGHNEIVEKLPDYFELQQAVGVQLDTIGKLLGVNRTCRRAPDYEYRTLNDDLYRFVLLARIGYSNWDGSVQGFLDLLDRLFPDVPHSIIDNQDCSYDVNLNPALSYDKPLHILFTGYELLPHPVGVLMNIGLRFVVEQLIYAYNVLVSTMELHLGQDNADPDYFYNYALRDSDGALLLDENDAILIDEEGN